MKTIIVPEVRGNDFCNKVKVFSLQILTQLVAIKLKISKQDAFKVIKAQSLPNINLFQHYL